MKASILVLALFSFVLSGCFFSKGQDNPGKDPQKGPGLIQGAISMVDAQGIDSQGLISSRYISARFSKKSGGQGIFSIRQSGGLSSIALKHSQTRATVCDFYTENVAASAPKISVGKLSFGTENSQQLVEIPHGQDNNYFGQLQNPTFPAGIYKFNAEGSSDAVGFKALAAMPTSIANASLNGQMVANGPMQIKRSEGIQLQWTTPSKVEEYDLFILRLVAQQGNKQFEMECAVQEKSLSGTGTTQWNITAADVEKYSKDLSSADVYLLRGSLVGAKDDKIGEIVLEGIRAWAAPASFVN